jgi:hypothetical protein
MLGEGGIALSKLEHAIREFQAREDRRVDLKVLREVIDELKCDLFFHEWAAQKYVVRPVDLLKRDRS